jgi:hypothetical protein
MYMCYGSCICAMGHVYVLGVMYMCYGSCVCGMGDVFVSLSKIEQF